MRFDLGTLESGERSLPFGLLVLINNAYLFVSCHEPENLMKLHQIGGMTFEMCSLASTPLSFGNCKMDF